MNVASVQAALRRAATRVAAAGSELAPPPVTGGVEGVARYWRDLDEAARSGIIADHPEWIGGVDGIAAVARDAANRNRIPGERAELQAQRDRLTRRLESSRLPAWWHQKLRKLFSSADENGWYVDQKLRDLEVIEKQITHEHLYLLLLDVRRAKRGLAAIAIGDPDAATHISVTTPGLGTTVSGSLDGMRRQAEELTKVCVAELRRFGGGRERQVVANIAWLGYVPPNLTGPNRLARLVGIGELGTSRVAVRSAPRLSEFYRGLRATAEVDTPHITALGHSYGSLVTSLALGRNGGQSVDDVVFYGSPGLSPTWSPQHFRQASDYGLTDGHVYVMKGAQDRIAELGYFGGDPYDDHFVALSAAAGTSPDGRYREGAPRHADYPRTFGSCGDETLRMSGYNFAVIIVGLPELAVRA
ncbi:alpha/beta hydrolase [Williamsia maris]|uniref:Alpha/beta hydrolase n=1 Tax=Williamsia maris TaxID=72806 RepID=A0ABT1HIK0_9NOCA|nr:alpha/beta hydrolase [Williamsia maris]MCP2177765.1 Alpha/beta hydrolase [Williamsia maris]